MTPGGKVGAGPPGAAKAFGAGPVRRGRGDTGSPARLSHEQMCLWEGPRCQEQTWRAAVAQGRMGTGSLSRGPAAGDGVPNKACAVEKNWGQVRKRAPQRAFSVTPVFTTTRKIIGR